MIAAVPLTITTLFWNDMIWYEIMQFHLGQGGRGYGNAQATPGSYLYSFYDRPWVVHWEQGKTYNKCQQKKIGQANPDEESSTLPLSSRSTIAFIPGRLSSKGGTALSVRVRSH